MKVFYVQNPTRRNHRTGVIEPGFDLSPAEAFGELVELLPPTQAPFNAQPVVRMLTDRLEDYGDNDYILCIGNPALIGMTVAIAAAFNDGRVTMLQWSGTGRRYIPIPTNVYEAMPEEGE